MKYFDDFEKFDNLFYLGKKTGYRYLGSLECCYTLSSFREDKETGRQSIDNILRKDDYADNKKYCDKCSSNSYCKRKDDIFNQELECDVNEFFVERDVTQQIVFYNERLNSAVVFSVDGDFVCDNFGFNTVESLLWDIYNGVNSPYSEEYLQDDKEIEMALNKRDNLMYIRYLNSCDVDCNVCSSYRSLKDKKVYSLYDIVCVLNEGDEV